MSAPVPSSGSRWSDIENIVVRSPQINGFRCSLVHALCLTSGAEHFQQSNKLFIQQSLTEPLLSNRHCATLPIGPFDDYNGDILSLRSRRPRASGHICVDLTRQTELSSKKLKHFISLRYCCILPGMVLET